MPKQPVLPSPVETDPVAIRLSLSEAAKIFGINPRTIRRAMADGKIRYIVCRGRYQLLFESLLRWSQQTVTVRHKRDKQGIGQWVELWKIRQPKFSPRPPSQAPEHPSRL